MAQKGINKSNKEKKKPKKNLKPKAGKGAANPFAFIGSGDGTSRY